jgi:hypothetical protein
MPSLGTLSIMSIFTAVVFNLGYVKTYEIELYVKLKKL